MTCLRDQQNDDTFSVLPTANKNAISAKKIFQLASIEQQNCFFTPRNKTKSFAIYRWRKKALSEFLNSRRSRKKTWRTKMNNFSECEIKFSDKLRYLLYSAARKKVDFDIIRL